MSSSLSTEMSNYIEPLNCWSVWIRAYFGFLVSYLNQYRHEGIEAKVFLTCCSKFFASSFHITVLHFFYFIWFKKEDLDTRNIFVRSSCRFKLLFLGEFVEVFCIWHENVLGKCSTSSRGLEYRTNSIASTLTMSCSWKCPTSIQIKIDLVVN